MTRNLLILTLLAIGAAGAVHADPITPQSSVVVNLRGLNSTAVDVALRRAALSVCNASMAVDSFDCFDATISDAREKLRKLHRAEAAADAPTTLAAR